MKNIFIGIFVVLFCGFFSVNTGLYASNSHLKLEKHEQKLGKTNAKIEQLTDRFIKKGLEKKGIKMYEELEEKIRKILNTNTSISEDTAILLKDFRIFASLQQKRLEKSLKDKENKTQFKGEILGTVDNYNFSGSIVQAKKIEYTPEYLLMPKKGNSYIYINNKRNITFDTTYLKDYTLSGAVINTIGELEIVWNGDMKPKKVENFQPGDREFSFEISTENKNLQEGVNYYMIRGYAHGNKIYQRKFGLEYIDSSTKKTEVLKSLEYDGILDLEKFLSENNGYIETSLENKIEYKLGLGGDDFGKKVLVLPSGDEFIYSQTYDIQKAVDYAQQGIIGNIQVKSGNNFSNIQSKVLVNHEANFPSIVYFSTGDFVIETGSGHEGVSKSYFYNKNENKIYDFYEDYIVKNDGKLGYKRYKIINIDKNNITIEEFNRCCYDALNFKGFEYITFDIKSKKIIKRENIETLEIDSDNLTKVEFGYGESLKSKNAVGEIKNIQKVEGIYEHVYADIQLIGTNFGYSGYTHVDIPIVDSYKSTPLGDYNAVILSSDIISQYSLDNSEELLYNIYAKIELYQDDEEKYYVKILQIIE